MPDVSDAIRELAALLAEAGARPVLRTVAPSTLYDSDYHVAVVACAFVLHAKPTHGGKREILGAWLKLLQFVAVRPRLASDLRRWAQTRRHADLETWQRMPRGYIADRIHDRVIVFLVAAQVFSRETDWVIAGPRVAAVDDVYQRIRSLDLLKDERRTLVDLLDVRPNRTMLAGE